MYPDAIYKMWQNHPTEFLRFCLVGGMAFMIDAMILEFLVWAGLPALVARVVSIGVALQFSYLLHSRFTFRDHARSGASTWLSFISSNLIGAIINYGVFCLVLYAQLVESEQISRLMALVAGTAVALFFNYWANRRFVFSRKEP
jgi:putative flippase GtrA